MANFPDLGYPKQGFKVTNINKVIKTDFGANYVQTRKAATRPRKKFELGYFLDNTQYETLETFFNENIGGSFLFTNPLNQTVYNCFFSNTDLVATYTFDDLIQVDLVLEEV